MYVFVFCCMFYEVLPTASDCHVVMLTTQYIDTELC